MHPSNHKHPSSHKHPSNHMHPSDHKLKDKTRATLKYMGSFLATHHTTFEAAHSHALAKRGEPPRHGSGARGSSDRAAGDVHTRLMQRVLRQRAGLPAPEGAAAVPQSQGDSFIMYANGSCVGGVGMTVGYLRTLLHFALAYNLTFVHRPLWRFSHGEDAAMIESFLGFKGGAASCDFDCVTRRLGILPGYPGGTGEAPLREVRHARGFGIPVLEAAPEFTYTRALVHSGELWRAPGTLDALIAAHTEPGVVFTVGGRCTTRARIDAPTREWMAQAYRASFRAARRTVRLDPAKVNVALHYRGGDAFSSRSRLLHPGYYNVSARSVVEGLRLAGVQPSALQFVLYSEGLKEWFEREGFLSMLPEGVPPPLLRLGSASSTANDIDDMAHADIVILGRSSFSNVIATVTSGLCILNALATDEPQKHEFRHALMPTLSGYVDPERLAAAWRRVSEENEIEARRRLAEPYAVAV